MEKKSPFRTINVVLIILGLVMSQVVNSQKKADEAAAKDAVKLAYKFNSGKPVKYDNTSKIIQTMDINGQSMDVNVNAFVGCSIKSNGFQNNNLLLEVTIDSMYQNVDSPQGSAGGVIGDVKGKMFRMVISPEGKEIDMADAKKVIINVEGSGQTDAAQSFADFFPDMPSGSVSPGYTWNSTDTINTKSSTSSIKMVVKSDNKFEGFENLNGVKCARITSRLEGTRDMITDTQGMTITTKGTFTGNSELFFLTEEGYFLKQTVTTKLTGTIEITSPDVMTFPLVMDVTTVSEVKK